MPRSPGMDDVYVVEVAITGPKGMPADTVAKVAVSRMLMDGSDFDTVYSGSIAIDPKNIGREGLDHLSGNYGIRPEELYSSEGIDEMVRRLQDAVFGKECTSYNVGNVFEEYLSFKSWDCTGNLTILPSISMRLPPELRKPRRGSTISSGLPPIPSVPAARHASAREGGCWT